jgi:hypothetical protein
MTATSRIDLGRVWQPYDDEPLITREMLTGLEWCDSVARARLRTYLEAVVTRRAAPVHTAVAFNAVYFGYDVDAGGYVGGPLDFGEFPSIALGDQLEALPIGAMINIRTGGDLLPAEIVYKERAHAALGPYGETPGWLSGAPSGARGPSLPHPPGQAPVLCERLVFDSAAFGQEMAPTKERLRRLNRQGRTDEFGHLVVESRYPAEDADLGDADYYARYLVTRGRARLTSALAPAPLPVLLDPGTGDDRMEAAVRGLMATVRQALSSLDATRMWGEYAFTRTSMTKRLGQTGPLGRGDLVRLAESTARQAIPPAGRRTTVSTPKPAYTAIGPALRGHTEWQGRLHGTDYPLVVCHTNALLSDYALREHDETTGLLPSGVRLSLDDRRQGGGIWRAALVGDGEGPDLADDPVDEPSGRGWSESLPQRSASRNTDEPVPSEMLGAGPTDVETVEPRPGLWWPDDGDLGSPIPLTTNDGRAEWAQPLRLAHVLGEYLPLPGYIVDEFLPAGASIGPVQVMLRHARYGLAPEQSCHDAGITSDAQGLRLDRIAWPADVFPGMWLTCAWERGSRMVHARTTPLPHPVRIDGDRIGHRYDPGVLTRDGFARLPATVGSTPHPSPEQVLLTAVRRLGLLDRFGQAMLARTDVPAAVDAVMSGVRAEATRIEAALDELLATDRLTIAWGSRSKDGRSHHPPRSGEEIVQLVCYRPHRVDERVGPPTPHPDRNGSSGSDQPVREHDVAGFLRRIGHLGHDATDEQRELYREDHRRFRLSGPGELPPGFTYVRPHKRGH